MKARLRPSLPALLLAGSLGLTGCRHLGPQTVTVDRFDYGTALGTSWKEQTLLNIVKMRYMDLPVFLDVSSIVSGYSIQTGVTLNGTLSSSQAVQGNMASAGAQAIYTDRPTITYVPATGEKFLRGLITPIDPKNIFFLLQAGYAADFILSLSVESINGVRNSSVAGGQARAADPDFFRALQLMGEVQAAGAFGMRLEEDAAKHSTAVVFFQRDEVSPEILAKTVEIRRLLRLSPSIDRFSIRYGPMRGAENELLVNTRSMLQILQAFASRVDPPPQHLRDGQVWVTPDAGGTNRVGQATVRIRSSKEKPVDPFAAVKYRDHWYWIDTHDFATKRALTVVVFLFTLTESGSPDRLPLITIPAQ